MSRYAERSTHRSRRAAARRSGARGLHQPRRARPPSQRRRRQRGSPQNPGEPPAPAPPTPRRSGARRRAADTREGARRVRAALLELELPHAERRSATLAAMSVGAARLAEQQAAASSRADTTISPRAHLQQRRDRQHRARCLTARDVGDRHPRADRRRQRSTKGCRPPTTSPSRSSRMSPAATP